MSNIGKRGKNVAATLANPMASPMEKAGTVLMAVWDTAKELPAAIEAWGDNLKESQRHLMAFNGEIAGAFLESERRGMIRSMESGQNTSASTSYMTDALDELKDSFRPLQDIGTNLYNNIAGFTMNIVTQAAEAMNYLGSIAALLVGIEDNTEKEAPPAPFIQFMMDIEKRAPGNRVNARANRL